MYNLFVWKSEKLFITVFQRMFVLFFLLLSSNTLHVMVNTCICYWNTFQFKYIVEITFYVVKKFHVRLTSKDICFFLIFV